MRLIDADELKAAISEEAEMHDLDGDTYVKYGHVCGIIGAMEHKTDRRTLEIDKVVEDARKSIKSRYTSWVEHRGCDNVLVVVTAQVIKEADDGMD